MAIDEIISLCKKRWALPILALLAQGHVARVYPLSQSLGCSREAAKQALAMLHTQNILTVNPGHGHPLRPEFIFTKHGKAKAQIALLLWQQVQNDKALIRVIYGRWALAILLSSQQQVQFARIRTALHPITDRALSLSLSALNDQKLLTRSVDIGQHPPASLYHATRLGQKLVRPLVSVVGSSPDGV